MTKNRSKAAARQRLKERWFETGTSAFERVFPGARAKRFPEVENPYICPLCERPFPRTAIADRTLTFEDAPPKSYGGKPVALSCKDCNNTHGSSLDAPLSTLDSNEMSPCRLGIDGAEVIAYQQFRPDGRFFAIPENQNNPTQRERFFNGLEKVTGQPPGQLTYRWDPVKRRRADLAWLKAAYIVTFARWAYSYAFSPALRVVREQLRRPHEEIIRQFKLENRKSPRDTRFIIYTREPRELEGVAVGMGHQIVLLPADARDMTIYDRLEAALKGNPALRLTGDTYHWPTSPTHSIDVVACESVLVFSQHPATGKRSPRLAFAWVGFGDVARICSVSNGVQFGPPRFFHPARSLSSCLSHARIWFELAPVRSTTPSPQPSIGRHSASDELDVEGILAFAERVLPRSPAASAWSRAPDDRRHRSSAARSWRTEGPPSGFHR